MLAHYRSMKPALNPYFSHPTVKVVQDVCQSFQKLEEGHGFKTTTTKALGKIGKQIVQISQLGARNEG